jgi:hypothetical protein
MSMIDYIADEKKYSSMHYYFTDRRKIERKNKKL